MDKLKLGDMEQKFAALIWENAPLTTKKLTEMCEAEFLWKRTTTYTMLKRLCNRGIFKSEGGTVSTLISKQEFGAAQGEKLLGEAFDGSLPQFLAAFVRRKKLTETEIAEIQSLIDSFEEE